jgi:hypothetical protein
LLNFKHRTLCVRLCQIWYTFYVYQVHGKCPETCYLFSKFHINEVMVTDILCISNSEEINNLDFCIQLNTLFTLLQVQYRTKSKYLYTKHNTKFEVLAALSIKIMVFGNVMPCSFVDIYEKFTRNIVANHSVTRPRILHPSKCECIIYVEVFTWK